MKTTSTAHVSASRRPPISRRALLISAIATAAGLSLHDGAAAHGDVTLEQAKRTIGDRHKTFQLGGADRPLTAPEISKLVTGNTLYGMLYDDEPYVLSMKPDGSGVLKIADRPLDPGRWWIDTKANTISSQWRVAAKGEVLVQHYYATNEDGVFKTITEPKNRWSMFLVEEGIPPGMVL